MHLSGLQDAGIPAPVAISPVAPCPTILAGPIFLAHSKFLIASCVEPCRDALGKACRAQSRKPLASWVVLSIVTFARSKPTVLCFFANSRSVDFLSDVLPSSI